MFIGKSPSCIKQAAAKQSAQTSSAPKRSGLDRSLNDILSCDEVWLLSTSGFCFADDEILGVLSSFDTQSPQHAEVLPLETLTIPRLACFACEQDVSAKSMSDTGYPHPRPG